MMTDDEDGDEDGDGDDGDPADSFDDDDCLLPWVLSVSYRWQWVAVVTVPWPLSESRILCALALGVRDDSMTEMVQIE